MIAPNEALGIILNNISPLKEYAINLYESYGLILAQDVYADRDLPPADRSAMDGYAVRAEDIADCPCTLSLTGEIPAGSPVRLTVDPGSCVRIFTGAMIPPGADSIVMVEDTDESDRVVTFRKPVHLGKNIRRQGEESRNGDLILPVGTLLESAQVGLCASVGLAEPRVFPRPRVAVLCTGAELKDVSESVQPHEIRNSNGPSLCAALSSWGFTSVTHQMLPDNPETIANELKRVAETYDVILLTGGVSVGKYDFVPEALERIGATIHFHKVAMKPGKPVLYASLPDNTQIFGLPGNPLSSMAGFYEFVFPALKRLSGTPEEKCCTSMFFPLSGTVHSKKDRVRLVIARILWRSTGPVAVPLKSHGSADLTSGNSADGVVIVPVNSGELNEGTIVEFRPWRTLP